MIAKLTESSKERQTLFFQTDDIFEGFREGSASGSYCYGYTMTIGPDGRPAVKKYSSAQPDLPQTLNAKVNCRHNHRSKKRR